MSVSGYCPHGTVENAPPRPLALTGSSDTGPLLGSSWEALQIPLTSLSFHACLYAHPLSCDLAVPSTKGPESSSLPLDFGFDHVIALVAE